MKIIRLVLILFCALALMPRSASAQQIFNKKQAAFISCARERLGALYHFLDVNRPDDKKLYAPSQDCGASGSKVAPPKWLREILNSEMETRVLWMLGGDKKEPLNEAEMWRRAVVVLYNFLDLAQRINDGTAFSYSEVMDKFGVIRANLLVETDRLNTNPVTVNYDMRESMQGRGRSLLASIDMMNEEMNSVAESFVYPPKLWKEKFRKSVLAIAVLSNSFYGDIVINAPLPQPPPLNSPPPKDNSWLTHFLIVVGIFAAFYSAYKIIADRETEITEKIRKYMLKSAAMSDDYQRQFLKINVKHIVLGTAGVFALIGALFAVGIGAMGGIIVFLAFCALGLWQGLKMPRIILNYLKRARGAKVNAQLMDALILLSNSLKSGMDVVQGFEMVSRDLRPPIADEFALVVKNYQLGTPFEKSLETMEERVESRLLSFMVKAIVLQRQVGGNLTKVFERIVENIREESKLEDKLQAMTAQNRIQAIVVGVMPAIMVGVMFVFQPQQMIKFYSRPLGIFTSLFCIFWVFMGIKLVNKLGEIKV